MNTILSEFICGGEINVDKPAFEKLCSEYSIDKIKDAFVTEVLQNGSIDVPTKVITEEEARKDFLALCDYECAGLQHGDTFTRYPYQEPLEKSYFWESAVGSLSSDYFHQLARFHASSQSEKSPCSVWTSERSLRSVLNPIWSLKLNEITRSSLRTCISMRKYIAAQFRPAIAKAIYEHFNSRATLDISAGWGDRLAGFFASRSGVRYIGVDPNPAVQERYGEQAAFYGNLKPYKLVGEFPCEVECSFHQKPAEEMDYAKECVDLVFTSPPYYVAENYRYGIKDLTQSSQRYRNLDLWLEKFLHESLARAYYALARGGNLVINISDIYVKCGGKGNYIAKICDPMDEFITKKLGAKFNGCLGMKMNRRPNCHSLDGVPISKDASFCEPIWTYTKPKS